MEFKHKKSLGQNFLSDKNLLSALAEDAKICSTDNVLEIGPGLGALTEQLSKRAKKVLAIEADPRLQEHLMEKFAGTNVEFLFADFMEVPFTVIEERLGKSFVVVANLPYYITTPILFRFFCEENGASKIAVMVQKEVAQRMCAKPKSPDYGILSAACAYFGSPKILRIVERHNFNPAPNVDSAFVMVPIESEKDNNFLNFIRTCFGMRRKTLVNNLKQTYGAETVKDALKSIQKSEAARAEEFDVGELEKIFQFLSKTDRN